MSPSCEFDSVNPRGLERGSPGINPPSAIDVLRPFRSFSDSVLSSDACLRLQLLQEHIPLSGCRSASWANGLTALTRASMKEPAAADPRLAISLLPGEDPSGGFGQVARHGDHCLLVILGAFDAMIQPDHMGSCQPALMDHDQVARLYKRPLQIPVHISAHLPHTSDRRWNAHGALGRRAESCSGSSCGWPNSTRNKPAILRAGSVRISGSARSMWLRPLGRVRPRSTRRPRIWLTAAVLRITSAPASNCSSVLIGTKRIVGR